MNTSLRDQLLQAGLISKKQANEAERQQQRQERQPARANRSAPAAARPPQPPAAQIAKVARDQALNRRQLEKAEKKARLAQLKQLIEQSRMPASESGECYQFVDGSKIRQIAVDAPMRARLISGELVIVRHAGRYDVVPATVVERLREGDPQVFIAARASSASAEIDEAYAAFTVPDDLIW